MKIGLLGKKLGMTRVYDASGVATAVTVIEAGGNVVVQTKTREKEGYAAIQVGFEDQKPQRLTKPELGHFKKGNAAPKKLLKEFRSAGDGSEFAGATLEVTQFEVGDVVDVIGKSKGKGFQGVMRKHNASGQPMSHGSMMHRRTGAIGMRSTPGRIWKNASMPGHMGDERVTVQNLRVVQVRSEEGVILVAGAVPGPTGAYVVVRPAIKGQPTK
ncbi:MAG: 50S ribosomal protein L3 [Verrucomicrobia bacterium]|nr:50S ribosomal protein L3 [Verrucomicrobiota bacterium]